MKEMMKGGCQGLRERGKERKKGQKEKDDKGIE